uniref:NIP7 nucleolar pre-rRNA processing protein n=1 Tax=Hucho hucho TaxID=62062 RepID=A0A4W5L444_9TELE
VLFLSLSLSLSLWVVKVLSYFHFVVVVVVVSERILKLATNISRDKLVSVGTCFGKFTKTIKFRLHITALDFLAPYAKFKVWVKPGQEQSFLYGNHVLKSGLGRITENTNQYQGVVVYSMADVPLVSWPLSLHILYIHLFSQHVALALHILYIHLFSQHVALALHILYIHLFSQHVALALHI